MMYGFLMFDRRTRLGVSYHVVECTCGWSYRHLSSQDVARAGHEHLDAHAWERLRRKMQERVEAAAERRREWLVSRGILT